MATCGHCRDCQHWHEPTMPDPVHARAAGLWGYCRLAGIRVENVDPPDGTLAIASCVSEGIYGELETHADFGCVQFAARSDQ